MDGSTQRLPDGDDFFVRHRLPRRLRQDNWAAGWTELDGIGYFNDPAPISGADVNVTADITTDTTWTKGNAYILEKPIFVTNGATLTIQPGTTIYGAEDDVNDTFGSLIITRGCKIDAVGTCMNRSSSPRSTSATSAR